MVMGAPRGQCDIVLPEGLTLALKDNDTPAAKLGERFVTTGHSISSSRLANSTYRFIATSFDGEAIPGTNGTLFTMTLQADATLKLGTTLTGMVTNIEFNTQDNQKRSFANVTFPITIPAKDLPKCAMPTIAYDKGELVFLCETAGASFVSEVKVADAKTNGDNRVRLTAKYVITVYATAEGYADSDPVTATITWSDGTMKAENIIVEGTRDKLGDVNGDGTVDVSDYIGVANIILTGSVGGK